MATVWETVTGNSSLPVQAGNTFYDHLNNQVAGGVTRIVEGDPITLEQLNRAVSMDSETRSIEITDLQDSINMDLEENVEVFGNNPGLTL